MNKKTLTLKNTSSVPIGNKAPGEVFFVDSVDGKQPSELYWRKRLADKSVAFEKPATNSPAKKGK